jgi:pilus assembly protein Flp/PilA
MNKMHFCFFAKLRDLVIREHGQDLVEYALVVALIAFGAIAGMGKLATSINSAYSNISHTLGTNIT